MFISFFIAAKLRAVEGRFLRACDIVLLREFKERLDCFLRLFSGSWGKAGKKKGGHECSDGNGGSFDCPDRDSVMVQRWQLV